MEKRAFPGRSEAAGKSNALSKGGGWGGEEDIRTRKEKIKLEGRRAEESVLQYKLERATQL